MLQWRHNERDGVSNNHTHDCLLNRFSDADQRKHQSYASQAFVRGIHRRHELPNPNSTAPTDVPADTTMSFAFRWLKNQFYAKNLRRKS